MSPLARACALLALTASLFDAEAAVTPIDSPGPCAKFLMDIPSAEHGYSYNGIEEVKFTFKADKNNALHTVKNTCRALGSEVAKQIVEACNENYHATNSKPKLAPLGPEVLSPVYATCAGVPDCGPVVVHVTQVCDQTMVGGSVDQFTTVHKTYYCF